MQRDNGRLSVGARLMPSLPSFLSLCALHPERDNSAAQHGRHPLLSFGFAPGAELNLL